MSKKSTKNVNWEPDVRKGMQIANNNKDIKQQLKDNADRRKIDGFNPEDVGFRKK